MQQNKLMIVVLVVAILAGIGGVVYYLASDTKPPVTTDPVSGGVGMPTGLVVFEDGSKAPMGAAVRPDPSDKSGYTSLLQGRKCWQEYKSLASGKTWAYGKNGQLTSPE